MARLLMRGGCSPLQPPAPSQVIVNNLIGDNAGNLLYANGVFRALMVEGVSIDMDGYAVERGHVSPKRARILNERYDAYIIPLADAFRPSFIRGLGNLTDFVQSLDIPCVVIGSGVQTPFEPEFDLGSELAQAVSAFMNAILAKSALVGLRGAFTARYLETLGYKEGEHFSVIGCPSLYTYGSLPPLRSLDASRGVDDLTTSVSLSPYLPDDTVGWLMSLAKGSRQFYVAQGLDEMQTLYLGTPNAKGASKVFPRTIDHQWYRNDQVRFFTHAPSWIEAMKASDFHVSGKLHGHVAALLAGTPSFFVPRDGRMRELAEYHHLAHIPACKVMADESFESVIQRLDFSAPWRTHRQNLSHYIDFLDANGVDHIFKHNNGAQGCPYDCRVAPAQDNVPSIVGASPLNRAGRWTAVAARTAEKAARRLQERV